MNVVLFGSFYRGFFILNELLFGPLRDRVRVVGVATDDPTAPFVSAHKRVWQYPHTRQEETLVADLARKHDIPVYTGRVKDADFYGIYEHQWQPDLCLMATFGQRIDARLFTRPTRGFYNFHPSDNGAWPSCYAGGNPFSAMAEQGEPCCVMSLHEVDELIDHGRRVAVSDPIWIPPGASVVDMHKISSPMAALLLRRELPGLLGLDAR